MPGWYIALKLAFKIMTPTHRRLSIAFGLSAAIVVWAHRSPAMPSSGQTTFAHASATERSALVLIYNKQNPRWEAPGRGPRKQFTKPLKPAHLPPESLPPHRHAGRGSKALNRFVVLALAAVVITAVAAEWLAASLHLPAAWIAVLGGLILGPVTGLLDPAAMLGNVWLPLVALFLAVLLFHDLLRTRIIPVGNLGSVIARLVVVDTLFIGAGTVAIATIMGLAPASAALLAAILVMAQRVPGTVSDAESATLLKWEGIFLETVGIVVALVISEVALAARLHRDSGPAMVSLATTMVVGGLTGVGLGYMLLQLRRRGWIAEPARQPLLLAAVVTTFALPNVVHDGCGFFAVLALGLSLANPREATLVSTSGDLSVPPALTTGLLTMLAASVRLDTMMPIDTAGLLSLVTLAFAARAAIWRARLSWREQLALTPGTATTALVVATATVCASRLGEFGITQAQPIVTFTVLVMFIRLSLASLASVFEARGWGVTAARPEAPRQATPAAL